MAVKNLTTQLPWQGLAAGGQALSGLGGDPGAAMANLGPMYAQQYNAALNMNKSLYDAQQTGYQGLRDQLDETYQGIQNGYQQLYGDVLGRIADTNSSNIMDINTQYDALGGRANQDLASRGLGSSSMQTNASRAIALDRARAVTASQNQFAQLGAGYASSIGGQGLQAQQQGAGIQANLGSQQMNALNSVNAAYPNAAMYSQLAQQYGAQQQQQDQMKQLQQAMANAARGQMSSPGLTSPPKWFGGQTPLNMNPFGTDFGSQGISFGGQTTQQPYQQNPPQNYGLYLGDTTQQDPYIPDWNTDQNQASGYPEPIYPQDMGQNYMSDQYIDPYGVVSNFFDPNAAVFPDQGFFYAGDE